MHHVLKHLSRLGRRPGPNHPVGKSRLFCPTVESLEDRLVLATPQFITPLAGTPYTDWTIVNYVDLDPGPGVMDFKGGPYSYDGHKGIDMTLPNFAAMDVGVPVYAAADGVVLYPVVQDKFDRNTSMGSFDANYVVLDHGDGWKTIYKHLRKYSVPVHPGEFVKAGQIIGLAGSSGSSTDAHLHFEVWHNGSLVETYQDPITYWHNPLPYAGIMSGSLDHGLTDHVPSLSEFKERPPDRTVFPQDPFQNITFWAQVYGIKAGDTLTYNWYSPNGSLYEWHTVTENQLVRYGWRSDTLQFLQFIPPGQGTWHVDLLKNGSLLATQSFTVTSDPDAQIGEFNFNADRYFVSENGRAAKITVTRSSSIGVASVHYATQDGTAQAILDYTTTSGWLDFQPGELSKSFEVTIQNDSEDYEHLEQVKLVLEGGHLGPRSQAVLNIIDDDKPLYLSVNNVSITEGNAGLKNATFTVSLNHTSKHFVTVGYGTSNGYAKAGEDYIHAGGSVSFIPGETSQTFVVAIKGDTQIEGDETFNVHLFLPDGAYIQTDTGTGTIVNDDGPPLAPIRGYDVKAGPPRHHGHKRGGGRFDQTLTLVNRGEAVSGPLLLVLDGLSPKSRLRHRSGLVGKARSPFVEVPLDGGVWRPGQELTVVLEFTAAATRGVRFRPRVLAGLGREELIQVMP